MIENHFLFPEDIYSESLTKISEIKFTRREIDVMACLLNARGTGKIASVLSISLRTVVTHIRNIMLKLECNSRENIIDFIEKSRKLSILRDYYLSLVAQVVFEKNLKEISKSKYEKSSNNLLIYWADEKLKNILLHRLASHLNLAGLNAEVREYQLNQKIEAERTENSIFISLLQKEQPHSLSKEFLEFHQVDLSENKNYYFSVFEILQKLLPRASLDEMITNFKKCSEGIQSSTGNTILKSYTYKDLEKNTTKFIPKAMEVEKKGRWYFVSVLLLLTLYGLGIFALKSNNEPTLVSSSVHNPPNLEKEASVRSDLSVPTESSLLLRSELISQLENKLSGQTKIQTVALVGPGGAGKTTLARLYARYQKDNVIWEINAETKESLKESFENLAKALAATEEDKKILGEVKSTKNLVEREEKIIQLVKKLLKSHLSWILIFDNVEKFSDIQKYFPEDFATWGQGRVILTTRDSNIENNAHFNNIIQVGELNPNEKLDLFIKIQGHGYTHPLTLTQREEVKTFLEKIPPFPLDISIAAYYLKATNSSYTAYVEKLTRHDEDFADVQEKLLKESGKYNKSRYGIIILSLKHIINSHKDFKDLLLFISLLDSQNIPRDLLDKYKDSSIVDIFIYTLKKHSLITNGSVGALSTFSTHRSSQAIALAYLIKLMNLEENKHLIENIGIIFKNYVAEAVDKKNFLKMNLLKRHCEVLLTHTKLLTSLFVASLSSELGYAYRDFGNYMKAKRFLEQSIAIFRENSYENHPWFARSLGYLGSLYKDLGNYEKAKQLLEESIIIYKKNSLEDHPLFARALARLGNAHGDQGSYEKARGLFEESIKIFMMNSYENHPWFAWALAGLGNTYRELSDYKKGKEVLEKSIVIFRDNSYENHPWCAQALSWLGSVHRELGNYEKAKQLLEESIIIYKKNSFEGHPWFARSLVRLGSVYKDLHDYEKAKQILKESIIIYRKNSYENHPWFAWALGSLGSIYREMGDYEKAKQFLEQSIMVFKGNSYENHPWFARILGKLGKVYSEIGNYEKAKQLFEESIIIFKSNSYENHPWFARTLEKLANVYKDLGDYEKSRDSLERSFQIYKRAYGKDHVNTAPVLMSLGLLYMLEDELEIAEQFINKALRIFQNSKNPKTYECLESLEKLYLKKSILEASKKNFKKSQEFKTCSMSYLKQALEIVKSHYHPNSPHFMRIETRFKENKNENLWGIWE